MPLHSPRPSVLGDSVAPLSARCSPQPPHVLPAGMHSPPTTPHASADECDFASSAAASSSKGAHWMASSPSSCARWSS
eukprot:7647717-Alexandrium_andersonii.AAC.1